MSTDKLAINLAAKIAKLAPEARVELSKILAEKMVCRPLNASINWKLPPPRNLENSFPRPSRDCQVLRNFPLTPLPRLILALAQK